MTIIAVYTICVNLLILLGHPEHPLETKMLDAEVMTTVVIAARYFGGNQQTAKVSSIDASNLNHRFTIY